MEEEGVEDKTWEELDLDRMNLQDVHEEDKGQQIGAKGQTHPADGGEAGQDPAMKQWGRDYKNDGGRGGTEGVKNEVLEDEAAYADKDNGFAPGIADGQGVDRAILEALCNPRERATALRIDTDVEKFVTGTTSTTMEFPVEMTGYQRLLAHRIAQHYGLQTSSVQVARGLSRVVARRCEETRLPEVKIADLKEIHGPPETSKCTTEVTIKRRQGGLMHRLPTPPGGESGTGGPGQARSVKEREQEYKAARERILGKPSDPVTPTSGITNTQKENGADKNSQKASEDARSKAVFRNREKEMLDPDYRRGTSRFQRCVLDPNYANYFDRQGAQGMYNVPTYNTEFPALPDHQGVPNITAPPFFPQSVNPYGSATPAPSRTTGTPEHSYQHNSSGQTPVPSPPFTMPAHHVYPMHGMHYGYPPDMMSGPAQPPSMSMYPPPTSSHPAVFRAYGHYRGMQGYLVPPMPTQEVFGMVPPMSYPMYGGYPTQAVPYPDYNEMSGQYCMQQHMANGNTGNGSIPKSSQSLAGSSTQGVSQNSSQGTGEPSSPRNDVPRT